MRGTWSWMSPELLLQNGPIGTACDIYSLGMVRAQPHPGSWLWLPCSMNSCRHVCMTVMLPLEAAAGADACPRRWWCHVRRLQRHLSCCLDGQAGQHADGRLRAGDVGDCDPGAAEQGQEQGDPVPRGLPDSSGRPHLRLPGLAAICTAYCQGESPLWCTCLRTCSPVHAQHQRCAVRGTGWSAHGQASCTRILMRALAKHCACDAAGPQAEAAVQDVVHALQHQCRSQGDRPPGGPPPA